MFSYFPMVFAYLPIISHTFPTFSHGFPTKTSIFGEFPAATTRRQVPFARQADHGQRPRGQLRHERGPGEPGLKGTSSLVFPWVIPMVFPMVFPSMIFLSFWGFNMFQLWTKILLRPLGSSDLIDDIFLSYSQMSIIFRSLIFPGCSRWYCMIVSLFVLHISRVHLDFYPFSLPDLCRRQA